MQIAPFFGTQLNTTRVGVQEIIVTFAAISLKYDVCYIIYQTIL